MLAHEDGFIIFLKKLNMSAGANDASTSNRRRPATSKEINALNMW